MATRESGNQSGQAKVTLNGIRHITRNFDQPWVTRSLKTLRDERDLDPTAGIADSGNDGYAVAGIRWMEKFIKCCERRGFLHAWSPHDGTERCEYQFGAGTAWTLGHWDLDLPMFGQTRIEVVPGWLPLILGSLFFQ